MKLKKTIIAILVVLTVLVIFFINKYSDYSFQDYILIEKNEILLLLADTPELRMKGLSGVKKLEGNTAMLFIFNYPYKQGIWMKDMLFPLDIIWLDEDYRIVSIEQNVSPNTYPKVFYPKAKSLYVIEGNVGFAEQNGLIVGKVLNLNKK